MLGCPLRRPVLLRGPPGCGKSSLLTELARRLGYAKLVHSLRLDASVDGR
jgi:MoxR-like ATPase